MAAQYPSASNTFVRDHDATNKMVIDYARNINKFPVNKYAQIIPVKKVAGYYLEMTVEEGLAFFDAIPRIKNKLLTLANVGLGYIKLGQQATTLSGGEAQRVKLASELSKIATGRTLYILDEPTTGLHFEDIRMLLQVLNQLVDRGNTVLVIEHNLDVIRTADWIVDIGPEGGDDGGRIVAAGTPEEVALVRESHTGRFLKQVLPASRLKPKKNSKRRLATAE